MDSLLEVLTQSQSQFVLSSKQQLKSLKIVYHQQLTCYLLMMSVQEFPLNCVSLKGGQINGMNTMMLKVIVKLAMETICK